ncbi:MAG TPA: hypothetical protein VL371_04645 [Gemmataceae bacterium]|nr:hypothetical protein [Gemmataceae bacterium]
MLSRDEDPFADSDFETGADLVCDGVLEIRRVASVDRAELLGPFAREFGVGLAQQGVDLAPRFLEAFLAIGVDFVPASRTAPAPRTATTAKTIRGAERQPRRPVRPVFSSADTWPRHQKVVPDLSRSATSLTANNRECLGTTRMPEMLAI